MQELLITNQMREQINNYLGYELIRRNEVGHHIYDEAPGLGKIGIEGNESEKVVTNKQLDGNGNVEWIKSTKIVAERANIKSFHCKLTTVSSKKAKVLIASLFPDETFDNKFLEENRGLINKLRKQLNILKEKKETSKVEKRSSQNLLYGPNEMYIGSGLRVYDTDGNYNYMILYGPETDSC